MNRVKYIRSEVNKQRAFVKIDDLTVESYLAKGE